MGFELTYQQKVLLAAAEILREHDGTRGYDVYFLNRTLYLEPWAIMDSQKRKFADLLVGGRNILSREETLVRELEEKVEAMFG